MKEVVCLYCHLSFTDEYDIAYVCQNTAEARGCHWRERPRHKLKVVGPDYEDHSEDSRQALLELMRDGMAWHFDIDADGHVARRAEALIAKGEAKPPRGKVAKEMRANYQRVMAMEPKFRDLIIAQIRWKPVI